MRNALGRIVPIAVIVAVIAGMPQIAGGEPAVPERKPPKMVPDQWHSPSSLESFRPGHMALKDCERYGFRYGYSECNRYKRREPITARRPGDAPSEESADTDQVAAIGEENRPEAQAAAITQSEPVTATVESATNLETQIAQTILVTVDGRTPEDDGVARVMRLLREGLIGGVMLQPANIGSSRQVAALTRALRAAQPEGRPLIAFRAPAGNVETDFPIYSAVGLGGDPEAAFRAHANTARQLVRLGLDLSVVSRLSPQANAGSSVQAALSAKAFANAFVLAHRDAGLGVALALAGEGLLGPLAPKRYLDAVYFDSGAPESNALETLDLLPDAFEGLVITPLPPNIADDAARFSRVVVSAASAGSDLFVLPASDRKLVRATHDALTAALQSGEITAATLKGSVNDIRALKRALPIHIVETRRQGEASR
jgi:hypothetical protein